MREPVPHELLVEGRRRAARPPRVRRPEARRIGGEGFVDPDDAAVRVEPELELRVGEEQAPRRRVLGGFREDEERQIAKAMRERFADRFRHRLE